MRPAGILCKIAMNYKSKVQFQFNSVTANAKSVLSVLGAGVKNGDEIEVVCDGVDEEEALKAVIAGLKMVLANNIEGRGRQLLLPYAIYGAFAFFGYGVSKKMNFFVAAGCVLLVAASVMGLYFYKKDQSLVSFAFCFLLFWTAGEGLGVMQLSNLQSSWTNQTWLSFGGFYLLF